MPYHRADCSAQKYGPVKISCMQRIWAPLAAASPINRRCFSIASRLIFSRGSSVGVVHVAWISAHRIIRDISLPFYEFRESSQYKTNAKPNVTNHAYVYNVSSIPGIATWPPGVVAARRNPGTTGATATTNANIARQFIPFAYE